MGAVPLERLHQPVHADLRLAAHQQLHVVGQDLPLDEVLPPALDLLGKDNFEPFVYGRHQHRTSVLGAE